MNDGFHLYHNPTPQYPKEKLQERILAWVLTYGKDSMSTYISMDSGYACNPWPLYWSGLLDARADAKKLRREFRINQAGLDLLKEDL